VILPGILAEERFRVGKVVEDFCRSCKSYRAHTITVVDEKAQPQRVMCDTCGSQHNYRGVGVDVTPPERSPVVADGPPFDTSQRGELEALLRRVLREETGWTPTAIAEKWKGGELVMRPGKAGLQEKSIPIDGLFRKVVAIRNKLRVLEQQINAAELPDDLKLRLQSYITGCYGSLTSFNVLFAKDEDRFRGTGKED
ncbi:MAG: hypothetical protein ACRD21_21160, partial [Vicinamibacteria bacterium]